MGNASSVHHFGQQAKAALDGLGGRWRLDQGDASEIVFTTAAPGDNLAIRGAAEAIEPSGRSYGHERDQHEAVLSTMRRSRRGWRVTIVPVEASGIVSIDRMRDAITDDTALVSVMHANNEIGTIQPIADVAALAHERGALFHTDAVQSAGKISIDVRALGVDLLTIAGHKFYGPKGTGALWMKRGVRLVSPVTGGKQERNRRAGTENVPAPSASAAADVARRRWHEAPRLSALRDRLEPACCRTSRAPSATAPHRRGAEHDQHQHRSRRGRIDVDRLDLAGIAVSWIGVLVGHARTVAR